jgi:hypothetical protein
VHKPEHDVVLPVFENYERSKPRISACMGRETEVSLKAFISIFIKDASI